MLTTLKPATKHTVKFVALAGLMSLASWMYVDDANGVIAPEPIDQPEPQNAVFADGFEGSGDPCDHPLVTPEDMKYVNKPWVTAWSSPDGNPRAVFPRSVGFPVPIGSDKGAYTVIPFTPSAGQTIDITWDTAQANGSQGYPAPRPADSMFVGISACAGDLRVAAPCSLVAGAASLFWSTEFGGEYVCALVPGTTYYMTVSPVDPTDGLTPGEHTCSTSAANSAFGCDVQAVHTGS